MIEIPGEYKGTETQWVDPSSIAYVNTAVGYPDNRTLVVLKNGYAFRVGMDKDALMKKLGFTATETRG